MDFSIIIPSRNRASLLRTAIESVLAQTHASFEILVINDGSDGENEAAYKQIAEDYAPRLRMFDLESTRTGHGQSYGINIGAELAKGTYLTFLDDDDFWIDPEHLSRCHRVINAVSETVLLLYCDQKAIRQGKEVEGPVWLDGINRNPDIVGENIDASSGARRYSADQLIDHPGFGHLNVSFVHHDLFAKIGGMDNNIRYECDRDFYLRCIDEAGSAVHIPVVVSQHNVPDPTRTDNMSTAVNDLQKILFQLYVLDKARLFAKHRSIRIHGKHHKGYGLKRITQILVQRKEYGQALSFSWEGLSAAFSVKWLLFSLWLFIPASLSALRGRNKP